jgi:uncharacterized protein (DUF2249 family)/iron-sulfur cluster repair protein YtfE (RIC family)
VSTTATDRTLSIASSEADAAAADAVVAHHSQLAATLTDHVAMVLDAATRTSAESPGTSPRRWLLEFCDTQLLPHAAAEEGALYPAAAEHPEARLLVESMIAEHRVLEGLVDELRQSDDPVGNAATANALEVMFESHLAKENDLVLPLIAADPSQSLAAILSGMHELLGEHGDAQHSHGGSEETAPASGGCGGGGACACGETNEAEPTLDVRPVPHAIRHATVFGALDAVPPGGTLRLIAPHDPLPLLAQIDDQRHGAFTVAYDVRGPEAWQLRLTRTA